LREKCLERERTLNKKDIIAQEPEDMAFKNNARVA
jgi:hypothetical protein